jgi:hypothetical protein
MCREGETGIFAAQYPAAQSTTVSPAHYLEMKKTAPTTEVGWSIYLSRACSIYLSGIAQHKAFLTSDFKYAASPAPTWSATRQLWGRNSPGAFTFMSLSLAGSAEN